LRRQVETELSKCITQFIAVDGAGTITVKVLEDVLPIFDIFPEPGKLFRKDRSDDFALSICHSSHLIEADGATSIRVLEECEFCGYGQASWDIRRSSSTT